MSKFAALFTLLAAILTWGLFAPPAHAAARDRVFVASYGSDSNPCTFGSPCKTFQHAHDVVADSGEVTAIDSAGFGPIIISKGVTITSPNGVEAGIAAAAGNDAITINAPGASVTLRGLTLEGSNVADNGIVFNSGSSLTVADSVLQNFTNDGIDFQPNAAANLMVERVYAIGNGNIGFLTDGENAPLGAVVASTFDDCVASGNSRGFFADGFSNTAQPTVTIVNCKIANNTDTGIVSSDSTVFLAQSTVTHNATNGFWIQYSAATIKSFGNNFISDTTNIGTLTPIAQR
jgi:hypothetical protein